MGRRRRPGVRPGPRRGGGVLVRRLRSCSLVSGASRRWRTVRLCRYGARTSGRRPCPGLGGRHRASPARAASFVTAYLPLSRIGDPPSKNVQGPPFYHQFPQNVLAQRDTSLKVVRKQAQSSWRQTRCRDSYSSSWSCHHVSMHYCDHCCQAEQQCDAPVAKEMIYLNPPSSSAARAMTAEMRIHMPS